jgi:DNA-directed RNA polymerase specialized sigma24 family protein
LAALPTRQRDDLGMKVAGHSNEEIRAITNRRTLTNVNKSLAKARARIRERREPNAETSR